MTADLCSLIYALLFVPLMVWAMLNVMDNWRLARNRRAFRSLTPETCHRLRELIDSRGRVQPACAILVPEETPPTGLVESRFGGRLTLRSDGTAEEAGQLLVLIQTADLLPPPWGDRMLTVWKLPDGSFRGLDCDPAMLEPASLAADQQKLPEWRLQTVRIPRPVEDAEVPSGLLDYDPVILLRAIPELQEELSRASSRPAELLGFVLAPFQTGTYGFELSDICQVGGHPEWLIEDAEIPRCTICDRVGRFLFQFGDLSGSASTTAVCYVFGCEDHPREMLTIVQSL